MYSAVSEYQYLKKPLFLNFHVLFRSWFISLRSSACATKSSQSLWFSPFCSRVGCVPICWHNFSTLRSSQWIRFQVVSPCRLWSIFRQSNGTKCSSTYLCESNESWNDVIFAVLYLPHILLKLFSLTRLALTRIAPLLAARACLYRAFCKFCLSWLSFVQRLCRSPLTLTAIHSRRILHCSPVRCRRQHRQKRPVWRGRERSFLGRRSRWWSAFDFGRIFWEMVRILMEWTFYTLVFSPLSAGLISPRVVPYL